MTSAPPPPDYATWLAQFSAWLSEVRGRQAECARWLAPQLGWQFTATRVLLSRIIIGDRQPTPDQLLRLMHYQATHAK